MDGPMVSGELFADRYRIERQLGHGAMGTVFAAVDLHLQERVALKILAAELAERPSALARFQREVRLARRITHPNVARTHDIGATGGVHYLTMELIDGETLKQRLAREGGLAIAEVVRIASALCRGLAAAHDAGVLHRDLKPANVMLDGDGRVVITDFGVARPAVEGEDGLKTAGLVGTPRYMAPEVLDGMRHDERADLYALGVMLIEMTTGQPYRLSRLGDDDATQTGTRSGELGDHVPPALERLARSLVSFAPGARPATAAALEDELGAIPVVAAEAPTDPRPRARTAKLSLEQLEGLASAESATSQTQLSGDRPLPTGQRLAVTPFRGRGGGDADELAEVLSEELVDVLSRNTGVQVVAHRASSSLGDDDVTEAGRRVGAQWVVNGTVTRRGSQVRIAVRLVEVADGAQRFSDRFDVEVSDLFDVQDRIARRIGEALRVEMNLASRHGSADPQAIEAYLRGRRKEVAQNNVLGAGLEDFAEAIARAPDFSVAFAAHALAALRRWWGADASEEAPELERQAVASLSRALEHAPDIAETHFAAAQLASQRGDYRAAREALSRALDIAPTFAAALDYLGQLECEAGRGRSGAERIELARALDPNIIAGQAWLARWHALGGAIDEALARLDELDAAQDSVSVNRTQLRMRIAAWGGDRDTLKRCRELIPVWRHHRVDRLVAYIDVVLGDRPHHDLVASIEAMENHLANARIATYMWQIAAEAAGVVGLTEEAERCVREATDRALVDLDWLERCPALDGVRRREGYPDLRRRVRIRADAIWRG